jgi:predicted Fe-Mo cluster-binding NifX family protein
MRKIAIPVSNGILSPHFGHCDKFYICEVEGNEVISENFISAPPHEPGILPQWLNSQGVTDIIAGGMGHRAISLFKQSDINVFAGAPLIEPAKIMSC